MSTLHRPTLFAGLVLWIVVVGAAGYVRLVAQPPRLTAAEQAAEEIRWSAAEATRLADEAALSETMAARARRVWQAQYKTIPDSLSTPEVVERLNALSRSGFENFDLQFAAAGPADGPAGSFRRVSYAVRGRGYFPALYRFVWHVENERPLYRVRDLELDHIDLVSEDRATGRERLKVMVSFSLTVDAYYGGDESLGLPAGTADAPSALAALPVPEELLPSRAPAVNPFVPAVMETLPPNTHGDVDVEHAALVAIAGDRAVFQDGDSLRTLGVNDRVYLGRITAIDPTAGEVRARLNKGGIIDDVTRRIAGPSPHRAAMGPLQLKPTPPAVDHP